MKKITELTPEQIARFPEFVEKWTKIGLCTEPANRPEAEKGINLAYEIAGLAPPQEIIWCESPLVMLNEHARLEAFAGESICAYVVNSIVASAKASIIACVGNSVRGSVSDSLQTSVIDLSWAVEASIRDCVGDFVNSSNYGQQDATWLVFYEYYNIVCGLFDETHALRGMAQVAKNAGWWLPCEKVCFISERHNRVMLNERGQSHCENGSAIEYPDGFAIYAINGVRVPEQVVMSPKTLNPQDILHERNAEVQRVMIERFGEERFITECGIKPLHEDEFGTLYRIDFNSGDEPLIKVHVVDPSTGRKYWLGVPPAYDAKTLEPRAEEEGIKMERAKQAVAWSFGMHEDDYNPDIET